MISRVLMAILLTGWLSAACFAQAKPRTEKPSAASTKKVDKKSVKAVKISSAREAELLEFVRTHHPELAALLEQLKPMDSDQYRAALKDLDRDVRRIENVRKGSSGRSEAELKLWKSQSRIRLLAARLTMSSDEELRGQLREALRALRRLQLDVVENNIASTQQMLERQQRKLEQLEKRAKELQGDDESWVERKLADLERAQRREQEGVTRKSAKAKTKPKSAEAVAAQPKDE